MLVVSGMEAVPSLEALLKDELGVPKKISKACVGDLAQSHSIQSREEFLAAWRSGALGRQWLRDVDTASSHVRSSSRLGGAGPSGASGSGTWTQHPVT